MNMANWMGKACEAPAMQKELYVALYTYRHAATMNEKRVMNWRSGEGYGTVEAKKGRNVMPQQSQKLKKIQKEKKAKNHNYILKTMDL